jgi:large subunit ribosomal protein L7Ae
MSKSAEKKETKPAPKAPAKKDEKPVKKPVAAANPKSAKPAAPKKVEKKVEKPAAKPQAKAAAKPAAAKPANKDDKKKEVKKDKKDDKKKVAKPAEKKDTKKAPAKDDKKPVKKDVKKDDKKKAKKAEKTKEKPKKDAKKNEKKETKKPEEKKDKSKKASAAKPKKEKEVKKEAKDKKDKKKSDKPVKHKTNSVPSVKRPRNYGIGMDLPHRRDLSRMVRWPAYIRLQRKKKIMYERLKIPAMINQFTSTLDKSNAKRVFTLIKKYRPETSAQKKKRLLQIAKAKRAKKEIPQTRPYVVKFGVNHVTSLIERKKARLVVIANDVDPIEQVLWMPTLCRKLDIPYCIVKNKARLGRAVHLKTATCLAFVNLRQEDKKDFGTITTMCRANYNNRADQIVKAVGGGKLGLRSSVALRKRADALKKAQLTRDRI